jgi:hypothetical protein
LSKNQSMKILRSQAFTYREETFEERLHIVVPVVLMVEGVHHGSGGPLLYLAEELAVNQQLWNDTPIPLYHPEDSNGAPISCNSPDVIETRRIGRIYNARMDGTKLKGEAWVDIERCSSLAPDLLVMIRSGQPIEVSTGLFSDDEEKEGEWNGIAYSGIARNIRPDHLAFLPGCEGACNWADGCGVRANKKHKEDEVLTQIKTMGRVRESIQKAIKTLSSTPGEEDGSGLIVSDLNASVAYLKAMGGVVVVNELSNEDIHNKLQTIADEWDIRYEDNGGPPRPNKFHYVIAVFADTFIYKCSEGAKEKLYQHAYKIDSNKNVILEGDPVEVRMEREYIPVVAPTIANKKKEGVIVCEKSEKVKAFIGNCAAFGEDDTDYLMGLEDAVLDAKIKAHNDQLTANADDADKGKETPPDPTVDEYIAQAPGAIADLLAEGVQMRANKKAELIQKIKANAACRFTDDELKAFSLSTLGNLADLADASTEEQAPKNNAHYSLQGGAGTPPAPKMNERQNDGSGVPDAPSMFPTDK